MATKQILFRLEETSAKALENKLTEKGISKQFLFSKVVDMFINNELSFNNNLITSSDNKQITIDSSEVAETIKKYYLDDLANLIASDNNLIALVTEKLESNVLDKLEAIDSKNYQFDNKSNDNNVIANDIQKPRIVETETAELEEIEEKAVIIPEKKKKVVKGDSRGGKGKEKADTVKSADKPTHEGSIDDNAELILSQRQLAERFGYRSHKSVGEKFNSLSKEDFIQWTESKDPDGKGWYKRGKKFKVVTN